MRRNSILPLFVGLLLFMGGCGGNAANAQIPDEPKETATVSVISVDGGEVKVPAPTPSDSPAPQSSLSFEKDSDAVTYQFAPDGTLEVEGGLLTVRVTAQALKCNISIAEGAGVLLELTEGAAFTGAFLTDKQDCASVTLDEKSVWTLTADTAVGEIVNADPTFANVLSDGFSLSYDSQLAKNGYLNGAGKLLPGGGYLIPNI